ncbi:MAG: hypothetical protein HYX69_05715 [Planctomycetia bacterium]|nr:hypothetical protein [Planctomycetia bacterium]
MPRFLLKLFLFALLQCAIGAVVLANYRIDDNSFLAAVRDKHDRLAKLASPRLVLVGGSNVCFGTDSAQIEKSLAIGPVDMAMQGSLGVGYMLHEVEDEVRPGDIVVVSPEYEQLTRRMQESVTLMRLFEQNPAAVGQVDWDWPLVKMFLDEGHLCIREVVVRGIDRLASGKTPTSPLPYRREAFNEYGDVVGHHAMAPLPAEVRASQLLLGDSFDGQLRATIGQLNAFHEACRKRGADVYLFLPAIPERCLKRDEQKIRHIVERLKSDCTIPILNTPDEMAFPESEFFNTVYHLTEAGTARRTSLLVERLRDKIPSRNGTAASSAN